MKIKRKYQAEYEVSASESSGDVFFHVGTTGSAIYFHMSPAHAEELAKELMKAAQDARDAREAA